MAATLLLNPAVYAADKLGREGGNTNGKRKTPTAASVPMVKASAATRSRVRDWAAAELGRASVADMAIHAEFAPA